jgi:hypothetical protein
MCRRTGSAPSRLGPVDEVTEDPSDAGCALVGDAVRRVAAATVDAGRRGADARDDDAISDGDGSYGRADFEDGADAFMPRILPSVTAGTSPLRMCRSVPQMVVVSTWTMARWRGSPSGLAPRPSSSYQGP